LTAAKPFTPVQFRAWPPSLKPGTNKQVTKRGTEHLSGVLVNKYTTAAKPVGKPETVAKAQNLVVLLPAPPLGPAVARTRYGTGFLSGRSFEAIRKDG